MLKISNS